MNEYLDLLKSRKGSKQSTLELLAEVYKNIGINVRIITPNSLPKTTTPVKHPTIHWIQETTDLTKAESDYLRTHHIRLIAYKAHIFEIN